MDLETQEPAHESLRRRLTVPSGFRNLLEGLTVEILRCNPKDIYKFAAAYFHERLKERQEKGYDDCLLGSQIDGYYRYEPSGASKKELDKAATKIQSTFRAHQARQKAKAFKETGNEENHQEGEVPASAAASFGGKVYGWKEHAAATCIQAGYRGYNTRKVLEARNEAAITIQSGYRGYTVRKGLEENGFTRPIRKDGKSVAIREEEEEEEQEQEQEEEAAALKIQSAFRGHRAREAVRLRDEKKTNENENESDGGAANDKSHMEKNVNDAKDVETKRNNAATKIQSNYRGYYTRKQLREKNAAATTIQAQYRGYRVRQIRRTRSEAAVTIQSYYRGYRSRESLKKRHSSKSFLEVSKKDEFALHRDSRTSFSLPEGVQFEGNLDEDSDEEIDKMVDKLKAIQEASSPDLAEDKHDS